MTPEPLATGADSAAQLLHLGAYLAAGLGVVAAVRLLLRVFVRAPRRGSAEAGAPAPAPAAPSRSWRAAFWLAASAAAGCVLLPALAAVRQLYPWPGLGPWVVGLAVGGVLILAGGWLVAWLSGGGRPDP